MFQQMIQDVLALTEAGPRAEDVLECARTRLRSFEVFEGAEVLAQTGQGVRRFVVASGLGDAGPRTLAAVSDEPTLRVDTHADVKALGLSSDPALTSLLILRIGAPSVSSAVIVLGYSRAWSFAGTPLSRVRTIGQVALRLLLQGSGIGHASSEEAARLSEEVTRLRAHVSTLETEIIGLRADRTKKRSGKPR